MRQRAKRRMDARVAKLAGAAAALRSRSAELRRLIRQEELDFQEVALSSADERRIEES